MPSPYRTSQFSSVQGSVSVQGSPLLCAPLSVRTPPPPQPPVFLWKRNFWAIGYVLDVDVALVAAGSVASVAMTCRVVSDLGESYRGGAPPLWGLLSAYLISQLSQVFLLLFSFVLRFSLEKGTWSLHEHCLPDHE